ncbi:MAG: 30S ribosomal protein THX [Bacteroidetes bacterium]|nr:30S ribosomal protein THX [Bacteroidota bacterium]
MGKGDKKTKRGKIIIGSTGVRRQKKKGRPAVKPELKTPVKPAATAEKKVAAKKPAAKKPAGETQAE